MFLGDRIHLKLHADSDLPTATSRNTQHAKARLKPNPRIDSPVLHQRIPRLARMHFRGLRIHIRDVAARTARHDIKRRRGIQPQGALKLREQRPRRLRRARRRNPDRLPAVLAPRLVALHEDIRPEPRCADRALALRLQPRVQLREAGFAADEHGHHVREAG